MGLWNDEQATGLKKIVEFANSCNTKMYAQLAHAGRKSHLTDTAVGPSAVAYDDALGAPEALSHDGINNIIEDWIDTNRCKLPGDR